MVSNEDGLLQVLEVLYPASATAGLMDELLAKGLNVSVSLPQGFVSNRYPALQPVCRKIDGKVALYGLNRESAIEEIVEVGSTHQRG